MNAAQQEQLQHYLRDTIDSMSEEEALAFARTDEFKAKMKELGLYDPLTPEEIADYDQDFVDRIVESVKRRYGV